jgi:hypothetical protein
MRVRKDARNAAFVNDLKRFIRLEATLPLMVSVVEEVGDDRVESQNGEEGKWGFSVSPSAGSALRRVESALKGSGWEQESSTEVTVTGPVKTP